MTRIESPSSISTFNQCKRKYYYSYKLNLPRKESISTLTGKAVHSSLEEFFKIGAIKVITPEIDLKHHLLNLFNSNWEKSLKSLLELKIDRQIILDHYQDSLSMLQGFIEDFLESLNKEMKSLSFPEAFRKLKPETEIHLSSDKYNVHGYVDAILNSSGDIYILDYKTSSKDQVTEEYKLQLAIYALLYKERFNILPKKVGLHFLRYGTKKFLDVNDQLLFKAQKECELIKINTESDLIENYEKNPGPLCKWKTGQCSFYDLCFGVKKLNDFDEEKLVQLNRN